VRQSLTESILLAGMGALAGLPLAIWCTRFIQGVAARGQYPVVLDLDPDARVLGFTALVALITAFLFGLAPALRSTGVEVASALKQGGLRSGGRRALAPARLLVVFQIALSVLLVSVAGLMVRTLRNLGAVNAGFDRERVLLATVDAGALPRAVRAQFFEELRQRLGSMPGAVSASLSTLAPAGNETVTRSILVDGFEPERRDGRTAWHNTVTPEYFGTVGTRLLRGRNFDARDAAPDARTAIVSESMARFWFGRPDPVGEHFRFTAVDSAGPPIEIIGVAQDTRRRMREEPLRLIYTPWQQNSGWARATVAVRSIADPRELAGAVRSTVRAVGPQALVTYLRTVSEQLDEASTGERLMAMLSGCFGVLALALACVGLYGVMAYSVANRTREIGIRMALGADGGRVVGLVLRESLTLAVLGCAMGVASALATTRFLSSLLYGVTPRDPLTIGGAVVVLAITCLAAAGLPARRASRVEPSAALRQE
jgi:predicted permease